MGTTLLPQCLVIFYHRTVVFNNAIFRFNHKIIRNKIFCGQRKKLIFGVMAAPHHQPKRGAFAHTHTHKVIYCWRITNFSQSIFSYQFNNFASKIYHLLIRAFLCTIFKQFQYCTIHENIINFKLNFTKKKHAKKAIIFDARFFLYDGAAAL